MTKERANKVYDLLVSIGGASEEDRYSFVYHHTEGKYGCREWRFCGKLGFGGKYRSTTNSVDFYNEDKTSERVKIANKLNKLLSEIQDMKYFIAECFQKPNGEYLTLDENKKSMVRIKAESEDDAFDRLSELQQVDSVLTIEERWNVYEVTESEFNNNQCKTI